MEDSLESLRWDVQLFAAEITFLLISRLNLSYDDAKTLQEAEAGLYLREDI